MLSPAFASRRALSARLLAVLACVCAAPANADVEVIPAPSAVEESILPTAPVATEAFVVGERPYHWVGTSSCTSVNCHGGEHRPRHSAGDPLSPAAYHIWLQNDPHAQSYNTLLSEESRRMVEKLGFEPAHKEPRCLVCHAPEGAGQPMTVSARHTAADGVGCEACHGPAERWLAPHSQPHWVALSDAEKSDLGLRYLDDLAVRSGVCADCHIGAPGLDVDHDLIGAGHPRLAMEMSALHSRLPKHWRNEQHVKQTFDAKLWAVGRLVAASASLELLAERAHNGEKPWPEFSEYDCQACHHALTDPSWRQEASKSDIARRPGSLRWNEWNYALSAAAGELHGRTDLSNALGSLRGEMERPLPDRARVATLASTLSDVYRTEANLLQREPVTPEHIHAWTGRLSRLDAGAGIAWDEAAQRLLGLSAMNYSAAYSSPAVASGDRWHGSERKRHLLEIRGILRSAAPDSWSDYSGRSRWNAVRQSDVRAHFDAIHLEAVPH